MHARDIFAQRVKSIRAERGLTQKQFGEIFGYHETHIRHLENARKTPTDQFGHALDERFNIPGELMLTLARAAQEDQSEYGALKELEQLACDIRVWDHRVVPGLLQTREYACAVLGDPALVQERLERQEILRAGTKLHVVLDESVLCRVIGDDKIFREQLEFLIRPDSPWRLQVLPFCLGLHDAVSGPVTLLRFADDDPVAFVDSITGGSLVDDGDQNTMLATAWESLIANALPPALSREMISAVADDLREGEHNAGLA